MFSAYFLLAMAALDFALYASFRRRGMAQQAKLMLGMGVVAALGAAWAFYFQLSTS